MWNEPRHERWACHTDTLRPRRDAEMDEKLGCDGGREMVSRWKRRMRRREEVKKMKRNRRRKGRRRKDFHGRVRCFRWARRSMVERGNGICVNVKVKVSKGGGLPHVGVFGLKFRAVSICPDTAEKRVGKRFA